MTTHPCTITTDDDFEAWRDDAEEPSYLVYSEGMPWIAYQTEDCDWYATRPAHEDDRSEDGTYPGGVTLPLEGLTRPVLVQQSAEMPTATRATSPQPPATPRTITTAAELDALPVGSVVRSDEREYGEPIYARQADAWFCAWGWEGPALPPLPVAVLHDPSAPVVSDAAVPSATREDVAEALTGFAEAFAFIPEHLADDLLARFTITPRTDR